MSDTYSYEVLEPGGHARLVGNVLDRISRASANPASAVGSSRAVLGDPETASWMERTTAADGAALIEAIYGNTVVQDGSLLPVRMEGVETVGFNQWDEVAEDGYISDTTGENVGSNIAYLRSKGYIPVFPGMAYHFTCTTGNNVGKVYYYDADKAFLSFDGVNCNSTDKTPPASARYMRFWLNYPGSYQGDLCINLSDTARNGTYEPYWSSQRTVPASTYFPQGLRSAGTVYDELRADAAVTRVGAVDLGALDWVKSPTGLFVNTGMHGIIKNSTGSSVGDVKSDRYAVVDSDGITGPSGANPSPNMVMAVSDNGTIYINNLSYTDAAAFKAAMSGVMLHYALATPTTTPVDPALPLSYRTGAGGTERVMVTSGTTSAPPIFATRYPLDPADLAASIAPVDGPIAKTNHQVGDLIMLGFTLCKATQVIVTGETIAIGTNVTRTSVAAELAALSQ